MLRKYINIIAMGFLLLVAACTPDAKDETVQNEQAFKGKIGRTLAESEAAWPKLPKASEDAPNVIIWLLDDAGYASLQPYGGLIETPTAQRLADEGLMYTNFHSIPLCSPARAALLAGRNHHSVAMGSHIMSPAGFPGYNGHIPKTTASVAKILKDVGYSTFALGKWDQTPQKEASVAGPFDRWPSGQGFDRFYGFLGAEVNHFHPSIWSDHTPVSPAEGDKDYFLTTDMADQAIGYISGLRAIDPKKPFFMFFSTGAVHAPHQAPKEFIEKYDETFMMGWDTAREKMLAHQIKNGIVPPETKLSDPYFEIPRWADLPEGEKRLYARQMAAFAGQLEHTDLEFGRIVSLLEDLGELDNTIIIITSDNGGSGEGGLAGSHNAATLSINNQKPSFEENNRFYDQWGGPDSMAIFHAGWGMATNTPFPYFKHHVEGGGTHVPMIFYWPKRVGKTGNRPQFQHIIDIVPTILDLVEIDAPEAIDGVKQKPLDGISMQYTLDNPDVKTQRNLQYFEIWGNRGIYKDGWRASTIHNDIMPWEKPVPADLDKDVWRLYHVDEDFSMSTDLAASRPEKLKELQDAWEIEAEKYGVYPIDPDRRTRNVTRINKLGRKEPQITYERLGAQRINESLSPPVKNRSFTITAQLTASGNQDTQGVIATSGGMTGGYALYVHKGKPVFVHNLYNDEHYYVRGDKVLPQGDVEVRFDFEKNADNNGGIGRIFVNGKEVGAAEIPKTIPNMYSLDEGFDIGRDEGSSVTPEYAPPFEYTHDIDKVVFDLK